MALNKIPNDNQVIISRAELTALYNAQARKQGSLQLNQTEITEIAGRALEDEILYREGIKMGFDRDDHIIKQRIVQKMLALAEFIGGGSSSGTETDLKKHYEANLDRFKKDETLSFHQVYLRKEKESSLKKYSSLRKLKNFHQLGDPFPLFDSATELEAKKIKETLGDSFLTAVQSLEIGKWSDPIESNYGYHFIQVISKSPSRVLTFEEAKKDVIFSYQVENRNRLIKNYIASLKEKYSIEIEEPSLNLALVKKSSPVRSAASLGGDRD